MLDTKDREKLKTVLRRMRKTQHGETISLAWWEVDLILRAIGKTEKPAAVVIVPPWRKNKND